MTFADKREILNNIPEGHYCYDERGNCPYWSLREDRDAQEDGWCSILNKGDIELGEGKVVKEYIDGQWITVSEPVSWLSYGLLWDQCKECRYKISFK